MELTILLKWSGNNFFNCEKFDQKTLSKLVSQTQTIQTSAQLLRDYMTQTTHEPSDKHNPKRQ